MEKIAIFDVPAESGGALAILEHYYRLALIDTRNEYLFIVSTPVFANATNIEVRNYQWVKKNVFLRFFFEIFTARRIIRKYKIQKIISLQNFPIFSRNKNQVLYLHNALLVSDYRFSFFKERKLWVYNRVLSKFLSIVINKAKTIIVQTESMRNKLIKNNNFKGEIQVLKPSITFEKPILLPEKSSKIRFFYPASFQSYKNHEIIISALMTLEKRILDQIEVIFTIKLNDVINTTLYKIISNHKLPIVFVGNLDRKALSDYYLTSVLVFPSLIESLGLPLLEAMYFNASIISTNLDFSVEILKDYIKADFYQFDNFNQLAQIFEQYYKRSLNS